MQQDSHVREMKEGAVAADFLGVEPRPSQAGEGLLLVEEPGTMPGTMPGTPLNERKKQPESPASVFDLFAQVTMDATMRGTDLLMSPSKMVGKVVNVVDALGRGKEDDVDAAAARTQLAERAARTRLVEHTAATSLQAAHRGRVGRAKHALAADQALTVSARRRALAINLSLLVLMLAAWLVSRHDALYSSSQRGGTRTPGKDFFKFRP